MPVLVKQWKGRTGASAGEAVERKDGCQVLVKQWKGRTGARCW